MNIAGVLKQSLAQKDVVNFEAISCRCCFLTMTNRLILRRSQACDRLSIVDYPY